MLARRQARAGPLAKFPWATPQPLINIDGAGDGMLISLRIS